MRRGVAFFQRLNFVRCPLSLKSGEQFRPTGIERYVLPHLVVVSVADPSVISPDLVSTGAPVSMPYGPHPA